MGRSLYSLLARRCGRMASTSERREFLRQSLAATTTLLLSSPAAHGAAAIRRDGAKRVVVIGAGFSGLACAHELHSVGYKVTVLEARNRVAGRVLSANAANCREFVKGRNIEFGGELIGSNHPVWSNYAEKFRLEFLDVTSDDEAELPVVIGGRRLSHKEARELWDGLEAALGQLNGLAAPVLEDEPWRTPGAEELDSMSVQDWIDGLDVSPLIKRAVWINQTVDNGQDTEQQSLLGQLVAVKGGGLERYWTESEVYRCRGGNDQLAAKLAEAIGSEQVRINRPVRTVSRRGDTMLVETADGSVFECDDVVLTAPPKTWQKIKFSPSLPEAMNPQTGYNAKYFAVVKGRLWEKHDPKLSQYALSDEHINMTWDGTDNQGAVDPTVGGACLVGFSGGSACRRALEMDGESRERSFGEAFEQFFPGYKENVLKTLYMKWPKDPWALASYSFPAPCQVTTVGPLLAQPHMGGRLHIAGEHACYKFVGYMEGALQSGLRVAKLLAERDGAAARR